MSCIDIHVRKIHMHIKKIKSVICIRIFKLSGGKMSYVNTDSIYTDTASFKRLPHEIKNKQKTNPQQQEEMSSHRDLRLQFQASLRPSSLSPRKTCKFKSCAGHQASGGYSHLISGSFVRSGASITSCDMLGSCFLSLNLLSGLGR